MKIKLILARSINNVIGNKGDIPWKLPEDLKRFKELTGTAAVIMGRKTWESLPEAFRPLPNRTNIVITSEGISNGKFKGAIVTNALRHAISLATPFDTVWIIGGQSVYDEAMYIADEAFITQIDEDFEGDTFGPVFSSDDWSYSLEGNYVSKTGLKYSFIHYKKR